MNKPNTISRPLRTAASLAGGALLLSLLMGASRCPSSAPDVAGPWNLGYDDSLQVAITLGGALGQVSCGPGGEKDPQDAKRCVFPQLSAQGGTVTVTHDGKPLFFEIDCANPAILCPSEAFPDRITIDQDPVNQRAIKIHVPHETCSGVKRIPEPDECGPGTTNPDCEQVCDGEVELGTRTRSANINKAGDRFRLVLRAGFYAIPPFCALLGASVAEVDLETVGSKETNDWQAAAMNGVIKAVVAGGCLAPGDHNDDGTIDAVALGAVVEISTGFLGHPEE